MKSIRRRVSSVAVALGLCGVLVVGMGTAVTNAKTTKSKLPKVINLTAVEDMTGVVGYVGQPVVQGMQLAVDRINASKLLSGSIIHLTVLDTASSIATATTQFSNAVNSTASAIFGPLLSGEALAVAPLAQSAGVVDMAIESQVSTLLPIGNYIWRATVSQLRFANLVPPVVAKNNTGAKTVRILYDSGNPVLLQIEQLYAAKFQALGYTVLPAIGVPISGAATPPNWPAEATALEAGNPGAIGVIVIGANNAASINALRNSGYKGVLFGNEAATNGQLIPAGQNANGFIYPIDYNPCLKYPSSKAFTRAG